MSERVFPERDAPILWGFHRKKIHGQRCARHKQNVFEVSRLLEPMDVPTLAVYDGFIVPEDMIEGVHKFRYTGFEGLR